MTKNDLIRKLTSRKFWMAVGTFVVMIATSFFGATESEGAEIVSLVMAGGTMIAYIVGEGLTDAANIKSNNENSVSNNTDSQETDKNQSSNQS